MDMSYLPTELLINIFGFLDVEMKLTLYEVCEHFREILLSEHLAPRSFKLSFHNKRWSRVLNHAYLSAIKSYLVKLDISGLKAYDSTTQLSLRTELKSTITSFPNLEELNIAYTDLSMPDCLEICQNLPKLRKLSVNFNWPHQEVDFTDSMLLPYRQAFRNIEYLNFIGCQSILLGTYALFYFSEPDKPKELGLTFINENMVLGFYLGFDNLNPKDIFPYKKLTFENVSNRDLNLESKLMRSIQYKYEKIIIKYTYPVFASDTLVYATAKLLPAILRRGGNERLSLLKNMPYLHMSYCKGALWFKDHYSDEFYKKIKYQLSSALPVKVTASNVDTMHMYRASSETFLICHCAFKNNCNRNIRQIFSETTHIRNLTISYCVECYNDQQTIRVNGDWYDMTELKYLCLHNVSFCDETLNNVLSCCRNLETLIICHENNLSGQECFRVKMDCVKYGKVLKHIYLYISKYDVNIVLNELSSCPTLETIVLKQFSSFISHSSAVTQESILNIIEKCPMLNYIALPAFQDTSDNNLLSAMLSEVRASRPNFDYVLVFWQDFIGEHPRERVFIPRDSLLPEIVH